MTKRGYLDRYALLSMKAGWLFLEIGVSKMLKMNKIRARKVFAFVTVAVLALSIIKVSAIAKNEIGIGGGYKVSATAENEIGIRAGGSESPDYWREATPEEYEAYKRGENLNDGVPRWGHTNPDGSGTMFILVARPISATVLINGKNVAFDAYSILGNNYFKLRDLAYALSGTGKQFDVGWDGENNAISLTIGKPYIPIGGDMVRGSSDNKTPSISESKVYFNGKEVKFTAYNIGGNNYFKLRDIGETLDFKITWDSASNTISINTGAGYISE